MEPEERRALAVAPLWVPAEQATTRGMAESLGTSQSTVSRFWNNVPQDSAVTQQLNQLISTGTYVLEGCLVDQQGSYILLRQSVSMLRQLPAPLSRVSNRRIRMLLAADIVRDQVPESEASGEVFADQFLAQVREVSESMTPIVLASAQTPLAAELEGQVSVLMTENLQEWFGLASALARLSEVRVAESLTIIEQQLRHWYQLLNSPLVWTPPVSVHSGFERLDAWGHTEAKKKPADSPEDEVLKGIQEGIASGAFEIGDELSHRAVADRLKMGEGRVKKGVEGLAFEGLLPMSVDDEADVAVRLPSLNDIDEMYAARKALGSIVIRAAARKKHLDVAEPHRFLYELQHSVELNDVQGAQRIDSAFQIAVGYSSGLARVPTVLESFSKQMMMFITLFGVSYEFSPATILADDSKILASIQNKDADAAVEIWQRKLDEGAKYMLNLMLDISRRAQK